MTLRQQAQIARMGVW